MKKSIFLSFIIFLLLNLFNNIFACEKILKLQELHPPINLSFGPVDTYYACLGYKEALSEMNCEKISERGDKNSSFYQIMKDSCEELVDVFQNNEFHMPLSYDLFFNMMFESSSRGTYPDVSIDNEDDQQKFTMLKNYQDHLWKGDRLTEDFISQQKDDADFYYSPALVALEELLQKNKLSAYVLQNFFLNLETAKESQAPVECTSSQRFPWPDERDLPLTDELYLKILSFLPVNDFTSLKETSKGLYRIAHDPFFLNQSLKKLGFKQAHELTPQRRELIQWALKKYPKFFQQLDH